MSSKNPILKEPFIVEKINADGKFFSRVSRIDCKNEGFNLELSIDINIDLYNMRVGQNYMFSIATSLKKEGGENSGVYNAEELEKGNLIDEYDAADYVCYGKVFKIEEKKDNLVIYCSCGGLMMCLKGDATILKTIPYDARIYILIKKI